VLCEATTPKLSDEQLRACRRWSLVGQKAESGDGVGRAEFDGAAGEALDSGKVLTARGDLHRGWGNEGELG
jgi:hypothetical protein